MAWKPINQPMLSGTSWKSTGKTPYRIKPPTQKDWEPKDLAPGTWVRWKEHESRRVHGARNPAGLGQVWSAHGIWAHVVELVDGESGSSFTLCTRDLEPLGTHAGNGLPL